MVYGMIDKDSYNYITEKFIPVIKSKAARILFNDYKITQQDISGLLGVSQAEISKYMNEKIVSVENFKIKNKDMKSFVKSIVIKDEYNAQRIICKICPKGISKSCSIMIK